MAEQELLTRLQKPGPKRVLALDGGGIRGCITIGFLEQIEAVVKQRMGSSNAGSP